MYKFVAAAVIAWAWSTATFLYWGAVVHKGTVFCCFASYLSLLTAVSYVRAAMTAPGSVPACWRDSPDGGGRSSVQPIHGGRRRWCTTCHVWKPARAHHCSVCNTCVLKYDHHCPWIANCVGYYNHKYFLLLVGYATAQFWCCLLSCWPTLQLCLFLPAEAVTTPRATPAYCRQEFMTNNFYAAYIFTGILGVMLAMFAYHHACLALANVTTVEELDKTGIVYGKDWKHNLQEVFGHRYWTWPFPIQPHAYGEDEGVYFERQVPPDLCPLAPPPQRTTLSPDILTSLYAVLPKKDPVREANLHHYRPPYASTIASSAETTPGPYDPPVYSRSRTTPPVATTSYAMDDVKLPV